MYSAKATITTWSPIALADWPRNRYRKSLWRKTRRYELINTPFTTNTGGLRAALGGARSGYDDQVNGMASIARPAYHGAPAGPEK